MSLLIFGKTGQVAQELQRLAPEAIYLGRSQADLSQPDACAALIGRHQPDAVINAAAYTAVDRAEEEDPLATTINAAAPIAMARACHDLDVPFVHISTDYVFDGMGSDAFTPRMPTAPQNVYGRSKLAGEQGVAALGGRYAILRTSWVFSAHGGNFVKTMLRLSETRDRLTIVADQIGGPTPAAGIAQTCLSLAEGLKTDPDKADIYHYAGAPDVSWADFAREIFAQAGLATTVTDIPSSEFPTPAARPANSRLDCTSLQTAFDIMRPDWRAALKDVLHDLDKLQGG